MSVVNASYRWNAGDYARHSESQQQWGKELIAKLRLAGDEHLLDIGCGDGKVTAEIAARLPRGKVVGIDSSAEMITLAGTRYAENQFTNLRFVKMDARKLSFCAEFDVVFSNAALHWVTDQGPVLSGIYEALKPGGRLLMQMGGRGNAAVLVSVLEQVISEEKWRPYFNGFSFPYGFYGPDEYRPWLTAAGFDAGRTFLTLTARDMCHGTVEKFKGWIRTTWLPYLQQVPAGLQAVFIETITEKYIKMHPPDKSGSIHVLMQRLEITTARG